MLKGKTRTGFKFEIDERVLNNYELIELLADVEENPLLVGRLLTMLLGDRKKDLIDHVREEDGIVPLDRMMEEFEDIFSSGQDVKNS